jgi:hypothetical protein
MEQKFYEKSPASGTVVYGKKGEKKSTHFLMKASAINEFVNKISGF